MIDAVKGSEIHKYMGTMFGFVDAMDKFGPIRTEPVLIVDGGLGHDVASYACASYLRQKRNGMMELFKISTVARKATWGLLVKSDRETGKKAFSFSVNQAFYGGYITGAKRKEWFQLAANGGLTVDHELVDEAFLLRQRFELPKPMGQYVFFNDVTDDEFRKVLAKH
ncbi:hypothetical protein K437DRAFT_264638 [Tilletiaria anomala UBC 951]|uniref:Uncharacterized protein n=1 Tax=Tilletiaria anomala (strain ATCC 24038 / CBS 436.72 / UBC 951) TaxID=1037660 RepID=A0A066VBN9_TILAU|nr:uncharacterized protein K437DRAFT_264638 [Tilletiaria anomala UBC 951]KDN39172.1 hypothetical protein K437DRAFT_264638 [Tilletiaria anomala UBC 951]